MKFLWVDRFGLSISQGIWLEGSEQWIYQVTLTGSMSAHKAFLRKILAMGHWIIWPKGLCNCVISMVLNAHLHIELVISSKEERFELGFRGRRKGEANIFKGGDTDGTDMTGGIIATSAAISLSWPHSLHSLSPPAHSRRLPLVAGRWVVGSNPQVEEALN